MNRKKSKQITNYINATATAAKSLQSYPTLCDPIDGSPPGSPVPGILQAGTLEWVAISFSMELSICSSPCLIGFLIFYQPRVTVSTRKCLHDCIPLLSTSSSWTYPGDFQVHPDLSHATQLHLKKPSRHLSVLWPTSFPVQLPCASIIPGGNSPPVQTGASG